MKEGGITRNTELEKEIRKSTEIVTSKNLTGAQKKYLEALRQSGAYDTDTIEYYLTTHIYKIIKDEIKQGKNNEEISEILQKVLVYLESSDKDISLEKELYISGAFKKDPSKIIQEINKYIF
jgi:hypothetical protein